MGSPIRYCPDCGTKHLWESLKCPAYIRSKEMNDQIPTFTDNKAVPTYGLEQQILVLRSFNKTYRDRINQLSDENAVLQARVSVLLSMLCDAGVPLPPDIE